MESVKNEVVNTVMENTADVVAQAAEGWTMKHTLVVGGIVAAGIVIGVVGTKLYNEHVAKKNAHLLPAPADTPKQVEVTTNENQSTTKSEDKKQ